MKDLPEYTDITDEEDRKAAFEKYIKRQKEKLREAEHSEHGSDRGGGDRDRRGDRDRDRERERDRDRDRRYSSTKDRYRDESSVDGTPRRDRHADSSAMDVDGPSSANRDRKSCGNDDRHAAADRNEGDRSRRRSSRYGEDGEDDPERERRREKWASYDRRESAGASGRSGDRDHRDAVDNGADGPGSAGRRDRRERTRYSASPEPEERESKVRHRLGSREDRC